MGELLAELPFFCVPSMSVTSRCKGGAERSGERNRAVTHRNRIRGDTSQGERANDREALATKGGGVDSAMARGRPRLLPREISPHVRQNKGSRGSDGMSVEKLAK